MARILAVHGIGQQLKGESVLVNEWLPYLKSGLEMCNNSIGNDDLAFAFYGNLFRTPGFLSAQDGVSGDGLSSEEVEILMDWWAEAARTEPERVPSPQVYLGSDTLGRTPQMVQNALNSLSKSKCFANIAESLMRGDLRQVIQYMNNQAIRKPIRDLVIEKITPNIRVVIGHSLGSVIAYEALCVESQNVVSFLTIGSPLGVRNVIFDKLIPSPVNGIGAWPGTTAKWTNISDKGDVVALEKQLSPFFGERVEDVLVNNGANAHHGEYYLSSREAGEAISDGL